MGIRGASFELRQHGPLPANAGLVIETYGNVVATISLAGRDIATTTVWSGKLDSGDPAASSYSLLRPTTGDWPTGTLRVVARDGDRLLADEPITVGPAVAGAPPTCAYISAPGQIGFFSHPGGGSRPPATGITVAGIADPSPIVSIEVHYAVDGNLYVARDIAQTDGAVILAERADVTRVRITNVLGRTLELLPPFPRGTAPEGPLGMKF